MSRRRRLRTPRLARWGLAVALNLWCGVIAGEQVAGSGPAASASPLAVLSLSGRGGVPAWLANRTACRPTVVQRERCLDLEPDRDPYAKAQWHIRLPVLTAAAGSAVVVELEFVDQGAGLIEAWLAGDAEFRAVAAQARQRASYTRLNTGRVRRAWFEFRLPAIPNSPSPAVGLAVTGLQHLRTVRVLPEQPAAAWLALRRQIPKDVRPMVALERPMELVTTAGVDVLGDASALPASLEAISELAPLARVLGFTSIESYVTWKRLEPAREGEFDFSFYDAITAKLKEYQLKWFPLLIVGSAYALPEWFLHGPEDIGFVCLEHGRSNAIQSIWSPHHRRHVTRVLQAFGQHYTPLHVLEGVRLGPSGNYGESQYPASGNWGTKEGPLHIHIGWWAGDSYGRADFQRWLQAKYQSVAALNRAWGARFGSFAEAPIVLPQTIAARRQRLDFTAWYTDSMSDWCAWWAREARRALPGTRIYQSAGGWGFREAGTDFTAQTKAMTELDGGVRLTNETDSYEQNFCVTRLAATAARLYHASLGYEPASSHTARGVVGRFFHTIATQGDHLFTYHGNVFDHQLAIAQWLRCLPLLDTRQDALVEVALYYPETENQLDDAAFGHLYAWGFYPRARELRRVVDVDYLDERLIREGYLSRYKVLMFAWGNRIEADVQQAIDGWLRNGGTIIYPSFPRGPLETIEGNTTLFQRWSQGDTGRGAFHRYKGDMEPPAGYGEFAASVLQAAPGLHPWTRQALAAVHPERVFLAVQQDGHLLALNYNDRPARLALKGHFNRLLEPYGIARVKLPAVR